MNLSANALRAVLSRLNQDDVRLLGLFFEGLSDAEIEEELGIPHGTLRHRILRLSLLIQSYRYGREVLIRFYIDHILKDDLQGKPLSEGKEAYTQPGEKLAEWTAWAEAQRDMILSDPRVPMYVCESAMLIADPAHTGKSFTKLGELVRSRRGGMGITGSTYEGQMQLIYRAMGGGKRVKLFVVVVLAPLT